MIRTPDGWLFVCGEETSESDYQTTVEMLGKWEANSRAVLIADRVDVVILDNDWQVVLPEVVDFGSGGVPLA